MLKNNKYEIAIRTCVAYSAIIAGTVVLYAGMTNTEIEGQPYSYAFWERSTLLFWLTPPAVALVYLFLWRDFRIISWGFTVFCCYWLFNNIRLYENKDFNFIYVTQGNVLCPACGGAIGRLSLAALSFYIAVLVTAVFIRKDKSGRLEIGTIAVFLLLFSVILLGMESI